MNKVQAKVEHSSTDLLNQRFRKFSNEFKNNEQSSNFLIKLGNEKTNNYFIVDAYVSC